MKRLILLIVFLLTLNVAEAGEVFKFGVADSNPNSVESLGIFVNFLSERSGYKFELERLGVDELINKLASGQIAFADLTSSAYSSAAELYKDKIKYVVTVAARNEKGEMVPYYKGVFFALKDSPYKTLLDLKGKSFAFVNKTSTSGYIYPLATLHGLGIAPEQYFGSLTFAGGHAKIFEGIKGGFLDAGVSNYDALEKAKAIYGNVFKTVGETAEIPSGAIVASSTVAEGIIDRVEAILLAVKPTDPVVNYPGFLYKGWMKKKESFYDILKKVIHTNADIQPYMYP